MGFCCIDRCFNTPHSARLGWLDVAQLGAVDGLQPGHTVSATLVSEALAANTSLRIEPRWAPGVAPLYLGYRTPVHGDKVLPASHAGKVNAYTAADQPYMPTVFEHALAGEPAPVGWPGLACRC